MNVVHVTYNAWKKSSIPFVKDLFGVSSMSKHPKNLPNYLSACVLVYLFFVKIESDQNTTTKLYLETFVLHIPEIVV